MKLKTLLAVLLFTSGLSACAQNGQVNKEGVGTIVGAGLGALVGSRFGGGKGKLATVAIGALGEAFLRSRLGQQLDKSDRAQAAIVAEDTRQLSILVAIQKKPMVLHAANLAVPGRFKVVRF